MGGAGVGGDGGAKQGVAVRQQTAVLVVLMGTVRTHTFCISVTVTRSTGSKGGAGSGLCTWHDNLDAQCVCLVPFAIKFPRSQSAKFE